MTQVLHVKTNLKQFIMLRALAVVKIPGYIEILYVKLECIMFSLCINIQNVTNAIAPSAYSVTMKESHFEH